LQQLESIQEMKDGAVVDREGGGWSVAPRGITRPTLEEREAVGIEQGATVGGESQTVVTDPAVNGPERREQPTPGVDAVLQHLFAVLVRGLAEVYAER
jgi:hypothetical protein